MECDEAADGGGTAALEASILEESDAERGLTAEGGGAGRRPNAAHG